MIIGNDSPLKVAAIGQSIMQAIRPRLIVSPLQLGLGVQMHHAFGSKMLIDILNKLGFSSSYSEVERFERNAASLINNLSLLMYQDQPTSRLCRMHS